MYRSLQLLPILVTHLRNHAFKSHYVFYNKRNGLQLSEKAPYKMWRQMLTKTGISPMPLHASRHTAVSHWVQSGIPFGTIREWIGHNDLRLMSRYAHLSPHDNELARERLRAYRHKNAVAVEDSDASAKTS